MKRANFVIFVIILLLVFADWTGVNAVEDCPLSPREKELLERVNALEQRLLEMEKRLNAPPAAVPPEIPPAVSPPETPPAAEAPAAPAAEGTAAAKTAAQPPKDAGKEKKGFEFKTFWKDGLRFETEDGNFKLKVGGRILNDWGFFKQSGDLNEAVGDENAGVEFRNARINLQGTIYKDFEYRAEYDFAEGNGRTRFMDVYLGANNIPYAGTLRIGHFREPFGMETLTMPDDTMFMERGLPNVFSPARNVGVMLTNAPFEKRMTWALGAFKQTPDWPSGNTGDDDEGFAITGRITGLPWYADNGRKLLHLGFAYSHRNPDGAAVEYASRPEAHLARQYLNTGTFPDFRLADARADNINLFGAEGLLICGPFSLQSEFIASLVNTTFDGDRLFYGYYVQGSYFLTGENRTYRQDGAVTSRPKVKDPLSISERRGWGAWELALRYSGLDLDDGLVRGGREHDITAGLNWYLNQNIRVSTNYVLALIDRDVYDGALHALQARFQVDF